MNKKRQKNLYYYILALGLLLVLLGFMAFKGVATPKDPTASESVVFVIKKGQDLKSIVNNLFNQNLIPSKFWFQFLAFISGDYKNLIAGRYHLSPSMTPLEILNKIRKGDTIKSKIIVKEGWTLRDIAQELENKGLFQAEEFFEVVGFPAVDPSKAKNLPEPIDFSDEFEFLKQKPKGVSLEGFLFPDTYFVGDDIKDFVRKMLANFQAHVPKEMRDYKTLIMASILEKEVRGLEDKRIVAGILGKRIKNNWPLQVDATLTYITNKGSLSLTKKDLAIDSPYNTYKYKGLPLTPISNPGLESIQAAFQPKESPYWFYLTTPQGKTVFSKTLREHAINKARYLR